MSRYVAELTDHRRYFKDPRYQKITCYHKQMPGRFNKKNKKYAKETVALKHAFSG